MWMDIKDVFHGLVVAWAAAVVGIVSFGSSSAISEIKTRQRGFAARKILKLHLDIHTLPKVMLSSKHQRNMNRIGVSRPSRPDF